MKKTGKGPRDRVGQAVSWLAEAWREGVTLDGLPKSALPRDAAEGYKVQAGLLAALEIPVGGWKIGATSKVAQKMLKTRGPFAAPVFAPRIYDAPARLPSSAYRMRGLEGEFAYRFAKPLPARRAAYDADEVAAALGSLHLAIEIVDSRFAGGFKMPLPAIIADLGSQGALVLGPPVPRWRQRDLAKVPVRMEVNGKVVGEGDGSAPMGSPMTALVWLVNHARRRGGIAAGQVVTTGTCCGFHAAAPGAHVEAVFGRLGSVVVDFVR